MIRALKAFKESFSKAKKLSDAELEKLNLRTIPPITGRGANVPNDWGRPNGEGPKSFRIEWEFDPRHEVTLSREGIAIDGRMFSRDEYPTIGDIVAAMKTEGIECTIREKPE